MKTGTSAWSLSLLSSLVLLLLSAVGAQAFEYDLRGYIKDYPVYWHRQPDTTIPQGWMNTTRARLKGRWFATNSITLAADYEIKVSTGDLLGSFLEDMYYDDYTRRQTERGELLDLSWELVNRDNLFVTHTIDRLYVEMYTGPVVARVGRQRVAWGVSSFFSPLDLFAPFAVGEIDKEEKAGIDAAMISFPFGELSNLEVIYSPQREQNWDYYHQKSTWERTRLGARFRTNTFGTDFSLVAGHFGWRDVAGGSISRSFHGALIKGEVLALRWKHFSQRAYATKATRECDLTETYNDIAASLGAEYGFAWQNLTIAGEVYYDGSGKDDPDHYDIYAMARGERTTLGQHYAAGSASMLITPLLTASFASLVNLDDRSALLSPALEYSFSENIYAKTGVQYYLGNTSSEYTWPRSEFGYSPDVYYMVLSWYF